MPDGGFKFTGEVEVMDAAQARKELVASVVDKVKHMDAFSEDREEVVHQLISELASDDADYLVMAEEVNEALKPYDSERAQIAAAKRAEARKL